MVEEDLNHLMNDLNDMSFDPVPELQGRVRAPCTPAALSYPAALPRLHAVAPVPALYSTISLYSIYRYLGSKNASSDAVRQIPLGMTHV